MAGNNLGPRGYYEYTSDTDVQYTIQTDRDLGTAGGLTLSVANPNKPTKFRCRGVWAESAAGNRKFIICNRDSALYSDTSQTVTIDTVAYNTTGRRGEALSYGKNT